MEGEQAGGDGVVRKPTASRPGEGGAAGFKAGAQESPMSAMVSGFLADQEGGAEENRSFSHLLAGAINSPTSDDGKAASTESGTSGGGGEELRGSSPAAAGGSFAERLAQRANKDGGGVAPRPPNPVRFKAMRGGYLTIPPGLSPTTLFDSSPVLLSTSQSEPSPTTGTFPMPPFFNGGLSRPVAKVGEASKEQPFVFKPFVQSGGPRPPLPPSLSAFGGMSQHQAAPALPPAPPLLPQVAVPVTFSDIQPLQARVPVSEPAVSQNVQPQQQQPATAVPVFADRPSEDGYNWRKYGQKQVKGSEYPRSYYKCTHVSCPMKKKVERSHDGQVTEIVYKGDHNHPKPQPTRRLSLSGAHLISDSSGGGFASLVKNEGGNAERDSSDASKGRAGSATGAADPSTSSTSDDEGGAGSKQSTEDGDDDEPDSKRRKKDKKAKEPVPPPRMIREPRVVVQTTSDVDILDDGYRWRKYGQKVVKGNPHPRSYYKCTNLGCPVRKHVERASNDAKAVITTYEGKHNHDVPAARNLGHEVAMQVAAAAAPVAAPTAKSLQDQGISFGNHRKLEESSGDVELGMSVGLGPKVQAPPVAATAISLAASIVHPSFNDAREPFLHGSGFGARLKQEQPDASHKII